MSLAHQNLAVAVGAAKEQAKILVLDVQRHSVPTGRSSSVYLSLVVMHQQLLAADPPPIAHFIPDLEHGVANWDLHSARNVDEWTAGCTEAFYGAIAGARRTFDIAWPY